MASSEFISATRIVVLGLTGAVCLLYAVLALAQGRPDPLPFWLPGVCGLASALVITAAARSAGRCQARQAMEEGYVVDNRRAQQLGFWVGLMLYPLFAVALAQGWVGYPVAYAAMGTLTAAAYLLGFVALDLRGRAWS